MSRARCGGVLPTALADAWLGVGGNSSGRLDVQPMINGVMASHPASSSTLERRIEVSRVQKLSLSESTEARPVQVFGCRAAPETTRSEFFLDAVRRSDFQARR